MFYTYILQSEKDNGYYIGHTSDIEQRLLQHNAGETKSIKHRIPFKLHYYETFETKAEAYRRELFFKTFSGRLWLIEHNIIIPGGKSE